MYNENLILFFEYLCENFDLKYDILAQILLLLQLLKQSLTKL